MRLRGCRCRTNKILITQPVCKETAFVYEQLCSKMRYTASEEGWHQLTTNWFIAQRKEYKEFHKLEIRFDILTVRILCRAQGKPLFTRWTWSVLCSFGCRITLTNYCYVVVIPSLSLHICHLLDPIPNMPHAVCSDLFYFILFQTERTENSHLVSQQACNLFFPDLHIIQF